MALTEYRKKRSFDQTPEPTGGKSDASQLHFVIQKHAASHLHYDFRLEMRGVLKSWAVPKGPSLNPKDKRLAMLVEDHPYDYKDFEGIIPTGNYGAGTVIIWDEGTYEPIETFKTKAEQEKHLLKSFYSGSVKIVLKGKKLKGEFALVKTHGRGENSWLLIKHKDKFASEDDITLKDKSVVSKKSLDQLAVSKDASKWNSNKDSSGKLKQAPKDVEDEDESDNAAFSRDVSTIIKSLSKQKRAKMPMDLGPMLATLVDKPFDDPDWLYEVKWDGYRSIAYMNKGATELRSRNNKNFNETYYPVHAALNAWGINAVVDGEIAVLNDKGMADFAALQEWRSEADGELVYYVFDVLWLDGYDLTGLPLSERRDVLQQLIQEDSIIKLSETFSASGTEFFALADQMGLEGIIAKKATSTYHAGARSKDWLKIKTERHQEAVIGGYTINEGTPKPFSALLLGVYEKGAFASIGPVGTGFSVALQKEIVQKLKKYVVKKCPFREIPEYNKPSRFRPNPPPATVTWVKPAIVVEISYRELTKDGSIRHPSFRGFREDKKPTDVHLELPTATEAVEPVAVEEKKPKGSRKSLTKETILKAPAKATRKTLLNPTDETQTRNINGHELKFSNLSKVYWPKEGYTKRDMLNYYYQVAPYILPYLINRPQSLNRYPQGITGHSFYHKDVTSQATDWMQLFPYHTSDGEDKNFLVPTDETALLYMANLGAIEMNPWNSTIHTPDNPDWCLIDLDPTDENTFEQVIQCAQVTKHVLDELDIPGYAKTSGSTGIHIYIPLGTQYTYDECQLFANLIASQVHNRLPEFTSLERLTRNRKGKIYVDFLQNRPKATLAAPYSLRPKPGATVSMPLHWDEVKKGLKMKDFYIRNALDRIKSVGDIFQPVLGPGIDVQQALVQLENADAVPDRLKTKTSVMRTTPKTPAKTVKQRAAKKTTATTIANKAPVKKKANKAKPVAEETALHITAGKKQAMPETVSPMLCTLVKEAFTDPSWLFEIKWDGYRLISHVKKGKVRMNSRSGLDYTAKYPPLAKALKELGHDVVLDGEAVVFNEDGIPDFDALQLYNGHDTPIVYCVFDILWMDGYNLMALPLEQRKQLLQDLLQDNETIRYSAHYDDGLALYQQMIELNLEGMVAKKRESRYVPGERGNNWVKMPTRKRQEFVIGGWAESDKGRSFRSLLFGAYNKQKKLEWIGRSGGGYKDKEMPGILKQLKALEIEESPFVNKVLDTKGAVMHWVKPQLVANFEFATWTKTGRIRKPATFLGFRKDKKASQVVREVPKETTAVDPDADIMEEKPVSNKAAVKKNGALKHKYLNADSNWKVIDEEVIEEEGDFDIGDCTVKVHNIDRRVWKEVPKAALIEYYHHMADYILPHIKDRPQSLHVKNINAGAPGMYIKDMEGRQPECASVYSDQRKHKTAGKRNTIDYLVCNNEATLLWMVNLGCIDINPWSSRTTSPEQPDYISIDLDPSDEDFGKAITTAQAAKQYLDEQQLTAFVKTSGQTGMHIYVPCTGMVFQQARSLSELLCDAIQKLVPKISTTTVSVSSRDNKLFVDPSQNDYADTLAAPYSVRPHHQPTISTPLDWKEVKAGLDPAAFTIKTIENRVNKKGDLWKDLLNKKVMASNTKLLNRLL